MLSTCDKFYSSFQCLLIRFAVTRQVLFTNVISSLTTFRTQFFFSFKAFDTVILVKGEQLLTVLIFTKKNNKQKFHCLLPYLQRAGALLIFQCIINI